MISHKALAFIEKYKELIAEENFDALYNNLEDTELDSAALTEAFLMADIEPMSYFKQSIPYGYAAKLPLTAIKVPEGILHIGTSAFASCDQLTSVHLPESLTSIRSDAFRKCSQLTDINLPENIYYIGPEAFEFCYKLKNIKLPEPLTTIELGCFNDCEGLESVIFGNKLEVIKTQAFSHCSKLSSLVFPESLESVSPKAFDSCDNLKELTFLGTIPPTLGVGAFANCPIEIIHFEGSTETWKSVANEAAFNFSNIIKIICRNGEVFKPKGSYSWEYKEKKDA